MSDTNKIHVKKGDTVLVLTGKDKGKSGKIIEAQPKKSRVIIEGINKVKRHAKPTQKNPQGGILTKEAPLHSSNVMVVCPECGKATRIKKVALASGKTVRSCKKCNGMIDKDK